MKHYETLGGHVTRGETYSKLIALLEEAQDCAAVLSHLHNTEDGQREKIKALGWLTVSEGLKQMRMNIIALAQKGLQ